MPTDVTRYNNPATPPRVHHGFLKAIAAIIFIAILLGHAHADTVDAWATFKCVTRPYPYGTSCEEMTPYMDEQFCVMEAGKTNTLWHNSPLLHMECQEISVDCSLDTLAMNEIFVCAEARRRRLKSPDGR